MNKPKNCSLEVEKEIPGQIPGMGNAGGDLEVKTPFVLPEGISVVGEVRGICVFQVAVGEGVLLL